MCHRLKGTDDIVPLCLMERACLSSVENNEGSSFLRKKNAFFVQISDSCEMMWKYIMVAVVVQTRGLFFSADVFVQILFLWEQWTNILSVWFLCNVQWPMQWKSSLCEVLVSFVLKACETANMFYCLMYFRLRSYLQDPRRPCDQVQHPNQWKWDPSDERNVCK